MAEVGYKTIITAKKTEQQLEDQLSGIPLDKVFIDTFSAKTAKREQLQACIKYLRPKDRLHVQSMDRIAINIKDLENTIDKIIEIGVVIEFHKENLVFSNEKHPYSRLLRQVMQAMVGFENSRHDPGPGRSRVLPDEKLQEAIALVNSGVPKTQVAKKFNVSRQTLHMRIKDYEKRKALAC